MFSFLQKKSFWVGLMFLLVPIASSILSTYHILGFALLGNPNWGAILFAGAMELGSIGSLWALISNKVNKWLLVPFFAILFIYQVGANVFSTFSFATDQLHIYATWLNNFSEFCITMGLTFEENQLAIHKAILAWTLGTLIPVLSLFFIKFTIDMLKPDKDLVEEYKSLKNDDEYKGEFKEKLEDTEKVKTFTIPIVPTSPEKAKESLAELMSIYKDDIILDTPVVNELSEDVKSLADILQSQTEQIEEIKNIISDREIIEARDHIEDIVETPQTLTDLVDSYKEEIIIPVEPEKESIIDTPLEVASGNINLKSEGSRLTVAPHQNIRV